MPRYRAWSLDRQDAEQFSFSREVPFLCINPIGSTFLVIQLGLAVLDGGLAIDQRY